MSDKREMREGHTLGRQQVGQLSFRFQALPASFLLLATAATSLKPPPVGQRPSSCLQEGSPGGRKVPPGASKSCLSSPARGGASCVAVVPPSLVSSTAQAGEASPQMRRPLSHAASRQECSFGRKVVACFWEVSICMLSGPISQMEEGNANGGK